MKENWKEYTPIIGIFVFASGNVHSLRYLFGSRAAHDSSLYWLLSTFIELTTAFAIWRIVEMIRLITKSKQTKENRRFYKVLLWSIGILVLPSLLTSIWANYEEFNHSIPLSFLCPLLAVVCAILSGIPHAERSFKAAKEEEKVGKVKIEPLPKERKGLTTSQRRQAIFDLLCKDLDQSPADLGKRFGVTAQTIRNDLKALAKEGKITYKDGRISLRPQKVVAEVQR